MNKILVDINADVGEGVNNESELLPLISSCNIACGGHAGDVNSMQETVQLAKKHGVKIGAHPSFPDREHFGRQVVNMSHVALYTSISSQIKSLMHIIRNEGAALHHVKPHGALYNLAAKDKKTAEVLLEVMKSIHLPIKLYVPYGSIIDQLAIKHNVPITYEAFIDRRYNDDLSLVSRDYKNAVITDAATMFKQVYGMVTTGVVTSIHGLDIPILAETFCIHGDHPKALNLVKNLRRKLTQSGITIQ